MDDGNDMTSVHHMTGVEFSASLSEERLQVFVKVLLCMAKGLTILF